MVTMLIRRFLKKRARPVHTIPPDSNVEAAIHKMTAQNTRALVVTDGEQPLGIFAERDVMRAYLLEKNRPLGGILLTEVMTSPLITVAPDDSVGAAATKMINADIRHLPVVEEGCVVGMLWAGDLIGSQIELLHLELQELKEYIVRLHDAADD